MKPPIPPPPEDFFAGGGDAGAAALPASEVFGALPDPDDADAPAGVDAAPEAALLSVVAAGLPDVAVDDFSDEEDDADAVVAFVAPPIALALFEASLLELLPDVADDDAVLLVLVLAAAGFDGPPIPDGVVEDADEPLGFVDALPVLGMPEPDDAELAAVPDVFESDVPEAPAVGTLEAAPAGFCEETSVAFRSIVAFVPFF